jgi:hypothetical protein
MGIPLDSQNVETALKDIPTRHGVSRKMRRATGGASSASAKTAKPRKKNRLNEVDNR